MQKFNDLTKDIEKAKKVAEILYNNWHSEKGIFGNKDMPEEVLPETIEKGSYEHLMFITLTVSIDYLRDAPTLWNASRKTINDKETKWIYYPNEVMKRSDEELIKAMQKYKLSKKPKKDSLDIWKKVCKSFYELYNSNPINFLKEYDYDALRIFDVMKSRYKYKFPYLSGNKILPLWIRMLKDVVGIEFKNFKKIPIPVDIHIARATLCLGCLKGKYVGNIQDIFREIDNVWENACKELPYYRLQLDEPLWHLSKYGCTDRNAFGDCINKIDRCPVSEYCIKGKVYVSSDKIEIETRD